MLFSSLFMTLAFVKQGEKRKGCGFGFASVCKRGIVRQAAKCNAVAFGFLSLKYVSKYHDTYLKVQLTDKECSKLRQ